MRQMLRPHRGIRIDRIQVSGGGGLIFSAGIIALALIGLPEARPLAALGLVGGAIVGAGLYYWHNQTRW